MNKFMAILFIGLIQCYVFSQEGYTRIKVSADLELIKISENAYVHVSYYDSPDFGRFPSNGLIFINDNKAFLFDTPMTESLTKDLVYWLVDSMNLTILGFVPNHWHDDCMGGLRFLKDQKIKSYAHKKTIEIAEKQNLPVPENAFKDSLQLQLGDKFIKCYYFGAAHSLDNIVVWIPSEDILFPGCMVKSINARNLGNTADGDLSEYPKTIDKMMDRFPNVKIVIPGHGRIGGSELIRHTRELITE
jgi:metallo-beta-lactamase class B